MNPKIEKLQNKKDQQLFIKAYKEYEEGGCQSNPIDRLFNMLHSDEEEKETLADSKKEFNHLMDRLLADEINDLEGYAELKRIMAMPVKNLSKSDRQDQMELLLLLAVSIADECYENWENRIIKAKEEPIEECIPESEVDWYVEQYG